MTPLVFDGAGSLKNRYLHGPGIDEVFADEDALGEILWALGDNQGTVRDWARSDGTIANHVTYDAFGKITSQTSATHEPLYAYTGREWDADAGMYYYRARWYDPAVGRWVSEDPMGFEAGDANLSRYVANSPSNYADPTGRFLVGMASLLAGAFCDPSGLSELSTQVQRAWEGLQEARAREAERQAVWAERRAQWAAEEAIFEKAGLRPKNKLSRPEQLEQYAREAEQRGDHQKAAQYRQLILMEQNEAKGLHPFDHVFRAHEKRIAREAANPSMATQIANALASAAYTGMDVLESVGSWLSSTAASLYDKTIYALELPVHLTAAALGTDKEGLIDMLTYLQHIGNEGEYYQYVRDMYGSDVARGGYDPKLDPNRFWTELTVDIYAPGLPVAAALRYADKIVGYVDKAIDYTKGLRIKVDPNTVGTNLGNIRIEPAAGKTPVAAAPTTPAAPKTRVSGHNPPISSRQQLHVNGTPGKSQFDPGIDVEGVVRTAWEAGTPVFDKHGNFLGKRFTFETPIGASPSGHPQNSIMVHWSPNNGIHGVPTTVGTRP